jgi:mannitol-1-phosphate 5-dehydrogenase
MEPASGEDIVQSVRSSGVFMKKQTIIHFGGGALGRGLVIPILVDSGCDVVLIDTNTALIDSLNQTGSYPLDVTDAASDERVRMIPLKAVVSGLDQRSVADWLTRADIVTTSVLRKNLVHVAQTLADVWGVRDCRGKKVICCENIENVGTLFRTLLMQNADPAYHENLASLCIPDVVVDRICTAHFPETLRVSSELFSECAVDANTLPETGISRITSIPNITGAFYKKRFLMNTYADTVSFLALSKGKTYLYEAAEDECINAEAGAYIKLLKRLLVIDYGYSTAEVDEWADIYRRRLSNHEIPRLLETVARNFWQKMTLEERFIAPIVQMMRDREGISGAVPLLVRLIHAGVSANGTEMTPVELRRRLSSLWAGNPDGAKLIQVVMDQYKMG